MSLMTFLNKCIIIFTLVILAGCRPNETYYDIVILNGNVYDGSGGAGQAVDIGIREGRIEDIGKLSGARAVTVIDAHGLSIAPGFIDLHAHLEALDRYPLCENLIRQGITTALGGPDGGGPWPFEEQMKVIETSPVGINIGFLVGHNAIRKNVLGLEDRAPTLSELDQMKQHVSTAMEAGAFGISTGLKYLPGTFANTAEVVDLASVASEYGGFYTSHLRDEGLGLLESVREAIVIGKQANIPIVLTHHKVVGKPMWGNSKRSLAMVDSARATGQDVMLDQYPYAASRTSIGILIPAWGLEGGIEKFKERIADDEKRALIKKEIVLNLMNDRGANDLRRVQLSSVSWNHELDGMTLHDWCLREKMEPTFENGAELVIRAQRNGDTRCIYHAMDEADIIRIMQHPFTAVATDGVLTTPASGPAHPRAYGTFPRVFAKYVREQNAITVTEAIRKMTSLPAQRMGLADRGLIKENYFADIVVFDEKTIGDTNSFEDPHRYPSGIEYVFVNGRLAVEGDVLHEVMAGKLLFGPGKKK